MAFWQFPGGSTGIPKLIPRTHDDYPYSVIRSNEVCGVTADMVYLATPAGGAQLPDELARHPRKPCTPVARWRFTESPSPSVAWQMVERHHHDDGPVPPLARL